MDIVLLLIIITAGVAAVLLPLVRGRETTRPRTAAGPVFQDDAALEAEVARYRTALRAGTLCGGCRYPNPDGSNFCADCGRPLTADQD